MQREVIPGRPIGRVVLRLLFGALATLFLTGGVPWVDGMSLPRFDGRLPPAESGQADAAYQKGRRYYDDALAFEAKADAAANDTQRARYARQALKRYRASADAFDLSLRRARQEDTTPDYLPQLLLEQGDALLKTSQYASAAQAYEAAVDVAPAFLSAHYGRMRARLALGDTAAAQAGYQHLLREADTRAAAWDYVDASIALIESWLAAHEDESLAAWLAKTKDELSDTVRWTALEAN